MSFATLGKEPECITQPATNITSSKTSSGATLNGTVIANYLSTTVTFDYGTTTSYGQTATAVQSPVTGNSLINVSADISGLTPGATYHFRVKTVNSIGTVNGSDLTFSTTAVVPTLTTTAVSAITQTTATSGGNIISNGGGTITASGVCWSTSADPVVCGSHTTTGATTGSFTCSITGLSPNTLYYVKAYATNSAGTSYGNEITFTTNSSSKNQIIADHTIVADFDKIPAKYMAEVKKMMVCTLGESHSSAYEKGLELLEAAYPEYAVNVSNGEAYTDQYLRVNSASDTGEDIWFTWYAYPLGSRPSASNYVKNRIKDYSDHGHPIHALGFGWCWDMVATNTSSTIDPDYGCRWFGRSDGGPDGNRCFGLDAKDYLITMNSVCMDTYLNATEDYISYCKANGYVTRIFFTTGPVDNRNEESYQGQIKHEYIRDFVKADTTRILFDYADILCYDDDGKLTTSTWNGHVYPSITSTNLGDESIGHIGPAGAIRLAKAQWWMLARIAGWDGN